MTFITAGIITVSPTAADGVFFFSLSRLLLLLLLLSFRLLVCKWCKRAVGGPQTRFYPCLSRVT